VKTRLARDLGSRFALQLYRCFVRDLLHTMSTRNWPVTICFHPPGDEDRVRAWLGGDYAYLPQVGGELGERMASVFQKGFRDGEWERLVLVGTDFPDLPGGVFDDAFDALRTADAVFGPAEDGGYYLVGFRRTGYCEKAFQNIPWGTATVLERSTAALSRAGRRFALIRRWRDVDEFEDLHVLYDSICGDRNTPARRTASFLASSGFPERKPQSGRP
jgi:rSAM/selenodomain-associated transferase 1